MNIVVLVFAVLLCVVNAVLWTVYSEMPMAGIGWMVAAGACVALRRWSIW